MNRVLLIILAIAVPPALPAAEESKESAAGTTMQEVDERLGMARVFSRVWAKLRAYIPRPSALTPTVSRTQIAGVRGAETTTSRLQPYWKGDKTTDPAYVEEAQTLLAAVELAQVGKLKQAAEALNAFRVSYPDSNLNPGVQFALGMVHGELGDNKQAITTLKVFTQSYPTHPLAADARQVIEELQGRY